MDSSSAHEQGAQSKSAIIRAYFYAHGGRYDTVVRNKVHSLYSPINNGSLLHSCFFVLGINSNFDITQTRLPSPSRLQSAIA